MDYKDVLNALALIGALFACFFSWMAYRYLNGAVIWLALTFTFAAALRMSLFCGMPQDLVVSGMVIAWVGWAFSGYELYREANAIFGKKSYLSDTIWNRLFKKRKK
jgi:hypothetical protein